jgi:hypothetical protein
MKSLRPYAWIMTIVLAFCLVGCSAESADTYREEVNWSGAEKGESYGGIYDSAGQAPAETSPAGEPKDGPTTVQQQKLVRTMRMTAQTQDMDPLLSTLEGKISALGGYVQNKSIYNGTVTATKRTRTAELTIRVPADKLDEFVAHVSGQSNVVSINEDVEDITLSYVATESRIVALETEQQRLLELLEKAENMSDLLQIEARLTEVRTQLEEVTSILRVFDNKVNYGTLYLSITEVKEYTEVVEELTVWQRIGNGLAENWESLCVLLTNLFITLVVSLPFLIPVGVIGLAVLLFIKLYDKKHPKKPQEPPKETKEEK